jgi:hypothetical protein
MSRKPVSVRIFFENKEDMNAYIRSELARPGVSMYMEEDSTAHVIHQANIVAAQGALHAQVQQQEEIQVKESAPQDEPAEDGAAVDSVPVPREAVVPEVNAPPEEQAAPEYNADGTYRNTGAKEHYMKLGQDLGEGEKVKHFFIAHEFGKLKRNYSFETKKDPLFPANYNTKIMQIYGTGYDKVTVNDAFWRFAIKEYEAHQRKRIWEGEETSNCFKKGAHHGWTAADRASLLINAVLLPPKTDAYKPAIL